MSTRALGQLLPRSIREAATSDQTLGEYLGKYTALDREAKLLEVIHELDHLKPLPIPRKPVFQDMNALRRWQNGAKMDETLEAPFAEWLTATQERTAAISENERRLRTTTDAQAKLRGTDHHKTLVTFHREEWGIGEVCTDSAEREEQVQARARHGVV